MKHFIFADESNTDKARYMLIGGIWVDEETYKRVVDECKRFKLENNWSEATKFNWKNLSKKTLPQYCQFIDIFFKYNLQFNCIIIDRKDVDLKANENKDSELGFYKFYYQLLRQNSQKGTPYYIYLDRRNNREPTRLEVLKVFLQKDTHKPNWLGIIQTDKGIDVKTIEFVNSCTYELIQFSDLLMSVTFFDSEYKDYTSFDSLSVALEKKISKGYSIYGEYTKYTSSSTNQTTKEKTEHNGDNIYIGVMFSFE